MADRIGRYKLERTLGTGTFATVWLATDEALAGRVAIKILADNWARHADVRRRFVDEAKLLFRIDHERIVRVHLIDELPDDRPYIVMTWADRATLQERLQDIRLRGDHLPVEAAITYAREIVKALAVVHSVGVVHRDIKPSNVLFRSLQPHQRRPGLPLGDEQLLLGDFGLAKHLAAESGFTLAAGTPAYMAPEQSAASSVIDPRADLFAAAAVLFEMLTGKVPFSADTLSGVGRAHAAGDLPRLAELRSGLPPGLQEVIDRGLQREPADRFESAAAFDAALEAVTGGPPPSPPPPSGSTIGSTEDAPASVARIVDWVAAKVTTTEGRAVIAEARARLLERPRLAIFGPMAEATALAWRAAGVADGAPVVPGSTVTALWLVHGPDRAEVRRGGDTVPLAVERDGAGRLRVDAMAGDADLLRIATPSRPLERFSVLATSDASLVTAVDAVLVPLPPGVTEGLARLNSLREQLKPTPAGPVLVIGVLVASGLDAAHIDEVSARYAATPAVTRLVRAVSVLGPDDAGPLDAHLAPLVRTPGELVASVGIALLERCLRSPEPGVRPARGPVLERLDALRLAHTALDELAVLRDEACGRVALPDGLRAELRAVLGGHDIDSRLGLLTGSLDSDRRAAAEAGLARWRTALNSGQIPFVSRRVAEVVCRTYDRLWAMAAP